MKGGGIPCDATSVGEHKGSGRPREASAAAALTAGAVRAGHLGRQVPASAQGVSLRAAAAGVAALPPGQLRRVVHPCGKVEGRAWRGRQGRQGRRRGEVAGLLEKMDKEIVKLSSSKMFYQYVKSQGWRVPHYLRRMEHADLAGADA